MRVSFLSVDYCLSFSSARRSRQAKAESQKCLSNLAKKWCLKFRAVFHFLGASKVGDFYLLTQIYLQNIVLYAEYRGAVRVVPDAEMVLQPSLLAVLCCQTQQTCRRAQSRRYRSTTSSSTLLQSARGSLRFGRGLIFPDLCEYAVSLLLSFGTLIPFCFTFFCPEEPVGGLWWGVCCCAGRLRRGCAVFDTKMILTVNRKLRLPVT